MDVRGILGHKFTSGLQEVDGDNSCDCQGICEPSGLVNLTACRYGAPVFVSLPHFYRARPFHLEKLKGLQPNRENHEFFATIEPVSYIKSGILLISFTVCSKVGAVISLLTKSSILKPSYEDV